MKERKSRYTPVRILLGCILFYGSVTGILYNCTSILFSAVIDDMGFRSSDLSLYFTVRSLVAAAVTGLMVKLYFKMKIRPFIILCGVISASGFLLAYFFNTPLMWILSGATCGVYMTPMMVVPSIVIKWFNTGVNNCLGICMAASGLVPAVFSPVLSALIENFGWRISAVSMGGIGIIMVVLAAVCLQKSPADVGLQPFGEPRLRRAAASDSIDKNTEQPKFRIASYAYVLMSVFGGWATLQFSKLAAMFVTSKGASIAAGAMFTSFVMVGNVVSKLTYGTVRDRLGTKGTLALFFGSVCFSLALLLIYPQGILLYIAGFCLGAVNSVSTLSMNSLCVDTFGQDHFELPKSRISSICSLISAVFVYVFPAIADFTGSYDLVLVISIAACMFSTVYLYKGEPAQHIESPQEN